MSVGIRGKDEFEDAFIDKTIKGFSLGGFAEVVVVTLENLELPRIW